MELLKVREVAELLQLSNNTITKLLRKGALTGLKVGKLWRIREDDVLAYINKFNWIEKEELI